VNKAVFKDAAFQYRRKVRQTKANPATTAVAASVAASATLGTTQNLDTTRSLLMSLNTNDLTLNDTSSYCSELDSILLPSLSSSPLSSPSDLLEIPGSLFSEKKTSPESPLPILIVVNEKNEATPTVGLENETQIGDKNNQSSGDFQNTLTNIED